MVAAPKNYWSVWVHFLYTEVSNVFSGPGETKVSKKEMDSSLLGTAVVNCLGGLMELMCCKKCWLCTACWMAEVLSTPKAKPWCIWGSADGLGFKLLQEPVGYNGTDRGSHSCAMDLFIIPTLEEKKVLFRQNSSNIGICCMDMEVLLWSCEFCCPLI